MSEGTVNGVFEQFMSKVAEKTAVIGVIGLGYVGLPLASTFHAAGFKTIGFDTDASKVDACNSGASYLEHLPDAKGLFRRLAESESFTATTDMQLLSDADAILIAVPTPLGPSFAPDLQFVEACGRCAAATLRAGQLVVLESTTYPGTTRELLQPMLDARGLLLGRDYFLAFSPEREDPGNLRHAMQAIPKLVGGVDPPSGAAAAAVYRAAFASVHPVSRAEVAEAAKLLENVYRAVNIALVNELKLVLSRMDIDIWEVLDAAETKPFGFHRFDPGPGWGGHCIPVDPFYLTWKAKAAGVSSHFIELAGEINVQMPLYVVSKLQEALNDVSKPLKGSTVLLLGVAYKADIGDTRESPAFVIWRELEKRHARVEFYDPLVPSLTLPTHNTFDAPTSFASRAATTRFPCEAALRHSVTLPALEQLLAPPSPEAATVGARADAVVVVTAHGAFRQDGFLDRLRRFDGPVVDTRRLLVNGGCPRLHRA